MERMYKKVYLTKKGELSVKDGHPWIYESDIKKADDIIDGDIVDIIGCKNQYLGSGFYNSNSKIRVRLLSRNTNDKFDKSFFKRRIEYALKYRIMVMKDLNSFRVIYGESDELPGLTVDKFNDILVVQILSLGIDIRRDMILDALYEVMVENHFQVSGIYLRCDVDIRIKEGLQEEKGWYEKIPHPDKTTVEILSILSILKMVKRRDFFLIRNIID